MKGLIWTVLGLAAYCAAIFAIGKTPLIARRAYVWVWLFLHRFCKHATYIGGVFNDCSQCTEEDRIEEQRKRDRGYESFRARRERARRLVKEL